MDSYLHLNRLGAVRSCRDPVSLTYSSGATCKHIRSGLLQQLHLHAPCSMLMQCNPLRPQVMSKNHSRRRPIGCFGSILTGVLDSGAVREV